MMLSAKSKLVCSLSLIVLVSGTISMKSIKVALTPNVNIATTKGNSNAMVFTTNKNKVILTNVDGGYYRFLTTKSMLRELNVSHIDYLLIFNYKETAQKNICEVAIDYSISNVYIFGEYSNTDKIGLVSNLYSTPNVQFFENETFEIDDFSLSTYKKESTTKAINYKIGSIKFLQVLTAISQTEISNNQDFFYQTHYDFCISNSIYDRYFDFYVDEFFARQGNITREDQKVSFLDKSILWTFD